MQTISQSPTDPGFVQDPYSFYEDARTRAGSLFFWEEYDMQCALSYSSVLAILRDRRFGREIPAGLTPERPDHQAGFWKVEDHSLLQLEPPRHTRLRGLILRAFTSRRIGGLGPEIEQISNDLIDRFDGGEIDLISAFAQRVPIIVICRLLGVPEERADDLLNWSHDMVSMYKAGRTHEDEVRAAQSATAFAEFMREYVEYRRSRPADDLITQLIAAEEDGERLSMDELIATCILLLNAGHEATVHTIGNAIFTLLRAGTPTEFLAPDKIDATVEETMRFDAPLHMFDRWAYEDIEVGRHTIKKNTRIGCLLAAANRDCERWENAGVFDPSRLVQTNASFGAGTHFCIGAPLARLEMRAALPVLFERLAGMKLSQTPQYAGNYHFHGLQTLLVSR